MGPGTRKARTTALLGAVLAGALLGRGDLPAASAADAASVQVSRLSIRFPRRPPREPGAPVLGSIALEAWLFPETPLWDLDPAVDPLRVTVGGTVLLDGPPFAGRTRTGAGPLAEIRVAQRGAPSPRSRVSLRLDPLSGRLRLRARAVDVSLLRASGAGPMEVRVEFGGQSAQDSVAVAAVGPARLSYPPPPGSAILPVPIPAPPPGPAPVPGPVTWSEITGLPGGLSPRGAKALVFRDSASWSTYWTSKVPWFGAPPAVDFTKDMVVIVGAAGRYWSDPFPGGTSHNYYIRIRSVQATGTGLQDLAIAFDLYDWSPSPIPGSVMPGDVFYPFIVLRVSQRAGVVALAETYIPISSPPPP